MLRSIHSIYQPLTITLFFFLFHQVMAQDDRQKKDSLIFQFKTSMNVTYDKSLVTRLIFSTQNSFVIRNNWIRIEPIINYRFGFVEPINRPKTDLENDLYVVAQSHFWHQKKIFPSVIGSYENSPNLRHLENRVYAGLGMGSYLLKSKNHFLQIMLYATYEQSDFKALDYALFRYMPWIKGNHYFEKQHVGINYTFQPFLSFGSDNNQRFRGTLKPYFKLTPKLDFTILYDMWYETRVSGIQPNEISVLLFGFNYSNF